MEALKSDVIICPQCAGENKINVDEKFIECTFCGSAIFVDKSKVVSHFVVTSNFSETDAVNNLRRWMAGNFQVKDLDSLAKITQISFYYFPMWYFKANVGGRDVIYLQPASSTSISEIKKINIPAGNLKVYHKDEFKDSNFVQPDVLLDSALSWMAQSGVSKESIMEASIVHIPFYQIYYEFGGNQFLAMVEASSGMVYANVWPAKSEAPFRIMFAVSIVVFFIISILSLVLAYAIGGKGGGVVVTDFGIKIFLYALASIPLIIMAFLIAKKV